MKVIYHRPQTFVDKCRIQHSTALIINKEPSRSLKAQVCCKKIASLIQGQCSCSRRTNKHFGALFFSRQSTHKMQFRQWLYLLQKLEKQLYCELVPLCPIILESTCELKVNISNELWLNLALTNCGCKVLNWTDKHENQFWYYDTNIWKCSSNFSEAKCIYLQSSLKIQTKIQTFKEFKLRKIDYKG